MQVITPENRAIMNADPMLHNAALVFDWGNTVMKVFPQYDGPMSDWPEVAEVDGIVEALEDLKDRCPMVLGTNAADSSVEQVWKALRRAGLAEYFRAVFTMHELGARKPEIQFFRQLESVLDRTPYQMVMVGDDFKTDVLGPSLAGWQTVWYNPQHLPAPGLIPLQDAEVSDLRDLPAALQRRPLPGYAQATAWLIENNTPYNILTHIRLVAAIAYELAVWLGQAGVKVDPLLTQRGAMLHDLCKIDSILLKKERGSRGDHARMARDFLLAHNQPELAEIADRHMPASGPGDPRAPRTWEQKLVHFADKLAEGERVVTPQERIQALIARYPEYQEDLQSSQPFLLQIQDEICQHLKLTPAEMIKKLSASYQV